MTDKEKLEKVRAEIERLRGSFKVLSVASPSRDTTLEYITKAALCKQILSFIDSMQKEPVSEDLEKAAKADAKFERSDDTEVGYDLNRYGGFIAGANWQKQQLMAKAVNVEVKVDAGGYPYIPQMELYDYDKDIPLAKEGDKYKVVLIKEE